MRSTIVFLDWDSTLTTSSTLPLIASIASWPDEHPLLKHLSTQYMSDLDSHDDIYPTPSHMRTSLDQESQYLASLGPIEKRSIDRIESLGLLKNVTASTIHDVAADMTNNGKFVLRDGWMEFLSTTKPVVHIISVAWSAEFIKAALCQSWDKAYQPPYVPTVYANEIDPVGSGKVIGCGSRAGQRLLTAQNKQQVMQRAVAEYLRSESASSVRTVYIGDSNTDLLCLLNADVGICIRDSPMSDEQMQLNSTLKRLKINTKSVGTYVTHTSDISNGTKPIWVAKDFNEIMRSGLIK